MEKITVIVSVYNTEKYLAKCLDTIASQTYTNLEVIIVNDGSTDHSEDICNHYVAADSRFRLISKQNGGVSSARNEGIKIAKGKYLAFVDSDDFLSPDVYQILIEQIERYSGDLVVCSFFYDYGKKSKPDKKRPPFGVLRQKNYFYQINSDPFSFYYGVVWNKLFRTDILRQHNIYFDESIHYMEDWNFLLRYLKVAKKIIKIPERLYFYNRANVASVTQNNDNFEVSYSNRIRAYRDLCEYSSSIHCYEENKDLISAYLLRYVINQKYKIILSSCKRKAWSLHNNISERNEIRSVILSMKKPYRLIKSLDYNLRYLIEAFFEYIRRIK